MCTNGNVKIFEKDGDKMPKDHDRSDIIKLIDNAEKFYISKWNQWSHEITKEEFLNMFCKMDKFIID